MKAQVAQHGTRSRYLAADRCRCDACREANSIYMRNYKQARRPGGVGPREDSLPVIPTSERLATMCWCERKVVWVLKPLVQACQTVSCGAVGCSERGAA